MRIVVGIVGLLLIIASTALWQHGRYRGRHFRLVKSRSGESPTMADNIAKTSSEWGAKAVVISMGCFGLVFVMLILGPKHTLVRNVMRYPIPVLGPLDSFIPLSDTSLKGHSPAVLSRGSTSTRDSAKATTPTPFAISPVTPSTAPPGIDTKSVTAPVEPSDGYSVREYSTNTPLSAPSANGSQYYVFVAWRSSALDCLAEVFSRNLLERRSVDEERERMRRRRFRIAYWHDPDWARLLVEESRKCGANAYYIVPLN